MITDNLIVYSFIALLTINIILMARLPKAIQHNSWDFLDLNDKVGDQISITDRIRYFFSKKVNFQQGDIVQKKPTFDDHLYGDLVQWKYKIENAYKGYFLLKKVDLISGVPPSRGSRFESNTVAVSKLVLNRDFEKTKQTTVKDEVDDLLK